MQVVRALAVALAIVPGLAACGGGAADGDLSQLTGSPPTTAHAMPTGDALIEPGAYQIPRSPWSVVDFDVTFPPGWYVQYGHVYGKNQDRRDELGFYAVVVDEIYTDPCHGEAVAVEVGPGVEGLVTALQQQPGLAVGDPVETDLGGLPATRVDLEVPASLDLDECRLADDGVSGLQVWYSSPADKYFVLLPDGQASVYVLDVDGEHQVFLTQQSARASDEDVAELRAVLESIRIHTS